MVCRIQFLKNMIFSMLPPYITLDIDKDILQVKEMLRSLEKQDLKNLFRELGLYDLTVRNKDSESLEGRGGSKKFRGGGTSVLREGVRVIDGRASVPPSMPPEFFLIYIL